MPAMPSIGDLANDVARWLYDQRIPVAMASVLVLIAIVALGVRLGWWAAARRHPSRTAAVAGMALVVIVPVGWYLGSPIFLRSTLLEPEPIAVAADAPIATRAVGPAPSASANPTPASVPTTAPSLAPGAAPSPAPPTVLAEGRFQGTDEFHFGRGTARLIEIEPGRYHLRLEDFSVRNGPDLYVYLSPDATGYAQDALELGKLKATDGSFGYDLPAGVDPGAFRSAIVWCKQFSHLFATATFEG
jgi:hypothetical protein